MKQTPVQWLYDQIGDNAPHDYAAQIAIYLEEAMKMEAEQMKIPELSDKEIQEHSLVLFHTNSHHRRTWISACKWYREQLKQRQ